ncbi:hypothetical protein GBA52_007743 [Prunus armeniaca]|nr:hypothetical protein GBA52_007743 [Prunus armeniaca]
MALCPPWHVRDYRKRIGGGGKSRGGERRLVMEREMGMEKETVPFGWAGVEGVEEAWCGGSREARHGCGVSF